MQRDPDIIYRPVEVSEGGSLSFGRHRRDVMAASVGYSDGPFTG